MRKPKVPREVSRFTGKRPSGVTGKQMRQKKSEAMERFRRATKRYRDWLASRKPSELKKRRIKCDCCGAKTKLIF